MDQVMEEENNVPDDANVSKRTGHVAVSVGNLILVWGGHNEKSGPRSRYLPVNELWVYNTILETWTVKNTKGTHPPGTSGAAVFMFDNKMYIFGGYCDERAVHYGNSNAIYMLDLATLHWHRIDCKGNCPLPCDKLASWVHYGKLYVFGGFGLNPQLEQSFPKKNFQFAPDDDSQMVYPRGWNNQLVCFDPVTCEWSWPVCEGTPPVARAAHAAAILGSVVYIFGGRHKMQRMNDMHCLNLLDNTWSNKLPVAEPLPEGRSWHSLTVVNDSSLLLYGGFSQDQKPLSDCWLFNVTSLNWVELKLPACQPRLWHTACSTTAGEIIIIGGCTDNILSRRPSPRKYANGPVALYLTPKSLLRLCLDTTISYKPLHPLWHTLPVSLQSMLDAKIAAKNLMG